MSNEALEIRLRKILLDCPFNRHWGDLQRTARDVVPKKEEEEKNDFSNQVSFLRKVQEFVFRRQVSEESLPIRHSFKSQIRSPNRVIEDVLRYDN